MQLSFFLLPSPKSERGLKPASTQVILLVLIVLSIPKSKRRERRAPFGIYEMTSFMALRYFDEVGIAA
ncbi:MAG: hypothetical protein ABIR24_10010, partial [Verrucomicrobiota bacterium]